MRWKRACPENGPAVFGKDKTLAAYEKRIKEMERLLGHKEVEIARLHNSWTAAREARRPARKRDCTLSICHRLIPAAGYLLK